jgi:protein-tyrosine phosphatase
MTMRAELYTIVRQGPGTLSVMARPRGGEWLSDEVQGWRAAGVSVVVSLLTPAECQELDLVEEAALCRQAGMECIAFPLADRSVPAPASGADLLIEELVGYLTAGEHVAIHCRMGIGRSAMMAAATLIACGQTSEQALSAVAAARGRPVPDTSQQREWVERYATRHPPAP